MDLSWARSHGWWQSCRPFSLFFLHADWSTGCMWPLIGNSDFFAMPLSFVRWRRLFYAFIWAPSSEFVSSSIPSWQILTAHVQPFRGARDLAFCLKVPLDSLLIWASSEGSGETARMRRLAWTFAARIGYKYQNRLTRSNYNVIHTRYHKSSASPRPGASLLTNIRRHAERKNHNSCLILFELHPFELFK